MDLRVLSVDKTSSWVMRSHRYPLERHDIHHEHAFLLLSEELMPSFNDVVSVKLVAFTNTGEVLLVCRRLIGWVDQ